VALPVQAAAGARPTCTAASWAPASGAREWEADVVVIADCVAEELSEASLDAREVADARDAWEDAVMRDVS
jgi:hypothetical protein